MFPSYVFPHISTQLMAHGPHKLWAVIPHRNNYFNLNRRCVYLIELSRMILGERKITKAFFRRSRFLFSIIRVGRHNDILAVANVTRLTLIL